MKNQAKQNLKVEVKTFQVYFKNNKGHRNVTFVNARSIEEATIYSKRNWKDNFISIEEYIKIKDRVK